MTNALFMNKKNLHSRHEQCNKVKEEEKKKATKKTKKKKKEPRKITKFVYLLSRGLSFVRKEKERESFAGRK